MEKCITIGVGAGKLVKQALKESDICSKVIMVGSMERKEIKELASELISMNTKEVRQRLDSELQIRYIVDNPIKFDQKRQSQQGWQKKHKQR